MKAVSIRDPHDDGLLDVDQTGMPQEPANMSAFLLLVLVILAHGSNSLNSKPLNPKQPNLYPKILAPDHPKPTPNLNDQELCR